MRELEQIRQIQEQINILKKEFDYCKEIAEDVEVSYAVRLGFAYKRMLRHNNMFTSHIIRMQQINKEVFLMRLELVRLNEIVRLNKPNYETMEFEV